MNYIDVFNGDADGIFSLIQLRKAFPIAAEQQRLITGVKRDNALVKHISDVDAQDAIIHILDVSFDKNTDELKRVLAKGAKVFYCDHHQAKSRFAHRNLDVLIDYAPTVCTGLLLSEYLGNAYKLWAICAAFGDSLNSVAFERCQRLGISEGESKQLQELGVLVNYNGYGATLEDLLYAPNDLYQALYAYDSPFDVVADGSSPFAQLQQGYQADLEQAQLADVLQSDDVLTAIMLEDNAWARRISGTLGNNLAHEQPEKAIVIATPNADGKTLTISLRAPKSNLTGAGDICASFPTGGGRAGAAGVNALPLSQLGQFIDSVTQFYR